MKHIHTVDELFKYQDLEYKKFNDKILNNETYPTIGIRIPILRNLAKEWAKNDYLDYINSKHTYYEEYMIHGLILGYIKIPFNELLDELDKFIPYIHDWAMVDIPVSNLKNFKKNLDIGYNYILKLLEKDTFSIRFGLILLLDYYLNDEFIDRVLDIVLSVKNNEYYVMMAKAWLLSVAYIKYKDKTIKILESNKLDKDTINKTISKICDSYRVSTEDKLEVKKLRRS